jgi:uncharacterized membrane protein YqjE
MTDDHNESQDHPDISKITGKINDHIETRLEYLRLVISEKVTLALVRMMSMGILLGLFLLFFLFINVAVAIWIGKHYSDYSIGFGAIALFYFVAGIFYLLLRKPVFEKKMADSIIKSMFTEEEEEEDEN